MSILFYMLLDEGDAEYWHDTIQSNKQKCDALLIGTIGKIGLNIEKLLDSKTYLYNLTSEMGDYCELRNNLIDYIFSEKKFKKYKFYLSLDSDEYVDGQINLNELPQESSNILYNYEFPLINIKYISDRAFSGTKKPLWLGSYHTKLDQLDNVKFIKDFKIIHQRASHNRKYPPTFNGLVSSYEQVISHTQSIADKIPWHNLDTSNKLFDEVIKCYDFLKIIETPARFKNEYYDLCKVNELYIRAKICSVLGKYDESIKYTDDLIGMGQRCGIFYKNRVLKGKYNHKFKILYYNFDENINIQYVDFLDPKKYWN